MKKLWFVSIPVGIALIVVFAIPAFAQTRLASMIPGQPLIGLAARVIIRNSGLPVETLPNGETSAVTKGRDFVNAYRLAHEKLYEKGWYRGISDDHTPLIQAMTEALKDEGYKGELTEVIDNFFLESDTQNAKELGYDSVESMSDHIAELKLTGKEAEAKMITDELDKKWK